MPVRDNTHTSNARHKLCAYLERLDADAFALVALTLRDHNYPQDINVTNDQRGHITVVRDMADEYLSLRTK